MPGNTTVALVEASPTCGIEFAEVCLFSVRKIASTLCFECKQKMRPKVNGDNAADGVSAAAGGYIYNE